MPTQEEIDAFNDEILEQAAQPKTQTMGDKTVTLRDIGDMIKARDAVAGGRASSKPRFGVRYSVFEPPGGG